MSINSPGNRLLARAHAQIERIFGTVSFTISGIVGTFTSSNDGFSVTANELRKTGGGRVKDRFATIEAASAQFSAYPVIEDALIGRTLTCKGRSFRIEAIRADEVTVTLTLENTSK